MRVFFAKSHLPRRRDGTTEPRVATMSGARVFLLNQPNKSIHRLKNIGTNDKFYRKVAFFMYTEMFNFRPGNPQRSGH